VFNTYVNTQWCISQTQQNFIVFTIVLEQHVSIFIESSSGPSKKIDLPQHILLYNDVSVKHNNTLLCLLLY